MRKFIEQKKNINNPKARVFEFQPIQLKSPAFANLPHSCVSKSFINGVGSVTGVGMAMPMRASV